MTTAMLRAHPTGVPAGPGPSRERGFSIVELLVVMALIAICGAFVVMTTPRVIRQSRADSSALLVASVLKDAREMAIAKRRNVEVAFTGTNTMVVKRWEYIFAPPAAPTVNKVLEKTVVLEGSIVFHRLSTNGAPSPPTVQGTGSPAVTYPAISGSPTVILTPEGTAIQTNGQPFDGHIFLGKSGDTVTTRCVTMTGGTALVDRWTHVSGTVWTVAK